jgi:hypothetical protein
MDTRSNSCCEIFDNFLKGVLVNCSRNVTTPPETKHQKFGNEIIEALVKILGKKSSVFATSQCYYFYKNNNKVFVLFDHDRYLEMTFLMCCGDVRMEVPLSKYVNFDKIIL